MTDTIAPLSSISNQATDVASATKNAHSKDYDMFLKMLVAQMKNQDPLSPMDPTEYVSQIATFTQVEQLTSMNTKMDGLYNSVGATLARMDMGYIGKEVESKLDVFSFKGGETEFRYVTAGSENVEIQILNVAGDVIRTENGVAGDGEHIFKWDGRDDSGAVVSEASYKIQLKAMDADGNDVPSLVSMRGIIDEVITENGVSILVYENGTSVDSSSVVSVKALKGLTV